MRKGVRRVGPIVGPRAARGKTQKKDKRKNTKKRKRRK